MKKILVILTLFFTSVSFAQLQNANWCFGEHARVKFDPTTLNTSVLWSANNNNPVGTSGYSGSGSSVSDANGQLLFYTDALSIWDKNNNEMPHGNQLDGTVDQFSGKNNSLIVPKPDHPGVYYVFTISTFSQGWAAFGHGGVHYTVVNTNLPGTPGPNSGNNGDVAGNLKNIALNNDNGIALDCDYMAGTGLRVYNTSIASTLHYDGDKVWVTLFTQYNQTGANELHAFNYLITANGFYDGTNYYADGTSPAPATSLLLTNAIYNPTTSMEYNEIKISPDKHLLSDTREGNVILYDFNNQTGILSNDRVIFTGGAGNNPWGAYSNIGVEFSPNNSFVYFSAVDYVFQSGKSSTPGGLSRYRKYARILQYAISKNTTQQIGQFVIADSSSGGGTDNIVNPLPASFAFGMQLGIDNQIYVTESYPNVGDFSYLGIITNPDVAYPNCVYNVTGLYLNPYMHLLTLPHWVHQPTMHIWPKVYDVWESGMGLRMDNNGNLISQVYVWDMFNNINHNGVTANPTGGYVGYIVQYNKATGATNWISQDQGFDGFTSSFGNAQFYNAYLNNYSYRNLTSGLSVNGPSQVPRTERIIAEDNGTFITVGGGNLWVRGTGSFIALPLISGYTGPGVDRCIYNPDPASRKLFISYGYLNSNGNEKHLLAIYKLNTNNTLTLLNDPYLDEIDRPIAQVNTRDEVFVYSSTGAVQKYDYNAIPATYTDISVGGLNNINLTYIKSDNQNVEDKLLTISSSVGQIYSVDTRNLTQRKTSITLPSNPQSFYGDYLFDNNDDVYLFGTFDGPTGMTIKNQTMPVLGTTGASFVTKFNIQSDFSFARPSVENFVSNAENVKTISSSLLKNKIDEVAGGSSITATLSPNPAKNSLLINLKQQGNQTSASVLVSITNTLGVKVFMQNTLQKMLIIDVSQFKTGMYYVTIATEKGDKTTKMFMKE